MDRYSVDRRGPKPDTAYIWCLRQSWWTQRLAAIIELTRLNICRVEMWTISCTTKPLHMCPAMWGSFVVSARSGGWLGSSLDNFLIPHSTVNQLPIVNAAISIRLPNPWRTVLCTHYNTYKLHASPSGHQPLFFTKCLQGVVFQAIIERIFFGSMYSCGANCWSLVACENAFPSGRLDIGYGYSKRKTSLFCPSKYPPSTEDISSPYSPCGYSGGGWSHWGSPADGWSYLHLFP